jgi:transposase-like protein
VIIQNQYAFDLENLTSDILYNDESRSAVVSIAEKIGCMPQTLLEWVKKAEVSVFSEERSGRAARDQPPRSDG